MPNVGALTLLLQASIAEFQKDLGKAAAIAEQQSRRMNAAFETVKHSLELVGVGLSVHGILEFSERIIKTAEDLQNLSTDTGSTVEDLSRLSNIAKICGKDFDSFQGAVLRLAAGLNGSEEGSSKTAQALQFLGISAKDPAAALQEVADKLNKYADGAGKAAIARDLFGRGGAAFISTLKTIADAQEVSATTTTKQALEAAKLAEDLRTLTVQSHALADAFLAYVVPATSELITQFDIARKSTDSFFEALKVLPGNPFLSISENLKKIRGQIAEYQEDVANGGKNAPFAIFGQGDIDQFVEKRKGEIAGLQKTLKLLEDAQVSRLGKIDDPGNYDARDIRARQKPVLAYDSAKAGAVDDPAKKKLEGDVKALDANIEEERALLATRDGVLAKYYDQGNISLAQFFDTQGDLRRDNLAKVVADYQAEIQLNLAYVNAIDPKTKLLLHSEKDRQDVLNKNVEIRKKQALAEQQYGKESVDAGLDRLKAERDYGHALDDISAQLLTIKGQSADAFKLTFDNSNETRRAALDADIAGADPVKAARAQRAKDELQQIEDIQVALAKVNDETAKFSLTLQEIDTAQQSINIDIQTGSITEIEGYNQKAALSLARVAELKQELAAGIAAANAISDPEARRRALDGLDQLGLKIKQLQADADALGQEFRGIFVDNFANALTDAVTGTKSLKDAFTDMAKSILRDIDQIAAKQIAQTLFGKDGAAGGLPDFLAKLFGASASGTSAAVPNFGAGDSFGGGIGGFAGGTDNAPGGIAWVGENGPEIKYIPKGAQIIPNEVLTARGGAKGDTHYHNNITVNVPPSTSGQTANQIAAAVASRLSTASRRGFV